MCIYIYTKQHTAWAIVRNALVAVAGSAQAVGLDSPIICILIHVWIDGWMHR